jgi:hypothetical protein
VHAAPAPTLSQELAIALGKLKIKTDKARLEDRTQPTRRFATANFGKCQSAACALATEPTRGKAAALAAVTDIYMDAIRFWRDLEEGSSQRLANEAQEALASIEIASEYKETFALPANGSKRPKGRSTGKGKGWLIEFCCDKDPVWARLGRTLGSRLFGCLRRPLI